MPLGICSPMTSSSNGPAHEFAFAAERTSSGSTAATRKAGRSRSSESLLPEISRSQRCVSLIQPWVRTMHSRSSRLTAANLCAAANIGSRSATRNQPQIASAGSSRCEASCSVKEDRGSSAALRERVGSAQLVDADQVARGIAEGAVPNPIRLRGRLLDDFGAAGLHPREGAVEVGGGQDDGGVAAFGHHLDDGAALVVGDGAGADGRRVQDDGRAGLAGGADRDPALAGVSDLVADFKAEGVAIEGQGCVRVVVRQKGGVNREVHGGHAGCGSVTGAFRFLIGLVTRFAPPGGIPPLALASWRREVLGGLPTSSVKRLLKVPSDEQPTAKQTSVTLRSPRRSN